MRFRIDLKILFFLLLFFITKQLNVYLLAIFFAFVHELSHLILGLLLGFKIQCIELMPFGFFTDLQAKIEDYNIKVRKI